MSKTQNANLKGTPLASDERSRVADLVERVGEREATELLSLSRQTLARALGGLPIHRASAEVIRHRLNDEE